MIRRRGWRLIFEQSPKLSWRHVLLVEYKRTWISRNRQIADRLIPAGWHGLVIQQSAELAW
ncbi:hypothetical protein XI06_24620 [Bradyrhizobium sp. CCBAU 11434]|uniref:hypothetical protein n=1 Tax=Bradyrhizobium sp. CCBAU 11434 TaxID=1630885 RepID=UPI002305F48C|nr:hypothetical protein [Bradyrhizobium sp. CCBAU 11434]MDA9523378.1 hypothetical protein [Bradyrhizobium sp. CCBAU 11434]